jgi:Protein of unknown function (DUF3486)
MPQVRAIDLLPAAIKSELDDRLIQSGFGGYVGLSEWLKEQGWEISKSSLGEYGKDFKDRLAALKLSREMAIAYQKNLPDDQGAQAEMLTTLAQDAMFGCLIKIQDLATSPASEEEIEEMKSVTNMLGNAVRSIAQLNRSDMAIKKQMLEIKGKVVALEGRPGMDATTLAAVQREIFGG